MGRIEEAMRRSRRFEPVSRSSGVAIEESPFVSPWSFREPAGAPEIAASVPVPDMSTVAPLDSFPSTDGPGFDSQAVETFKIAARFNDLWSDRLVVSSGADPVLVEQFRQLGATVHQAQSTSSLRVLMVTSAESSEGKSMTAINLALTLSESYRRRVLLVDADLRRPSLHDITRIPNTRGLGEALKSSSDQKVPAYQLTSTLTLVPAGAPDANPMQALASPRMRRIVQDAAAQFDWVILDAPPIGPVADSSLLVPMTDGVVFVLRAGRTKYAHVKKAVEAIGRERILGVVLNGADIRASGYQHYYAAYGAARPKEEEGRG